MLIRVVGEQAVHGREKRDEAAGKPRSPTGHGKRDTRIRGTGAFLPVRESRNLHTLHFRRRARGFFQKIT
jgi:hypothetical protein